MAFTVAEFRDLVRILEEQPQWRAELRRVLLTDELLELPQVVGEMAETQRAMGQQQRSLTEQVQHLTERVDTLTEQVQHLTERMDALTERVDTLTEQVQHLTERVDTLTEQVQHLTERVDMLTEQMGALTEQVDALVTWQRGEAGRREGERYEQQTVKRGPVLFSGGLGGATDEFQVRERLSQWLVPLLEGERFFEPEEDPTLSDLIWWKGEQVAVVEASLKVNGDDVLRAFKRARTLRSAGVNAFPVVVGEDWTSIEARELAKEKGVEWVINTTPSEGLIAFRRLPAAS